MTASTVAEAKKEAKACIDAIKGKKFEYPIFLDFEGNDKKLLTKAQATKLIKTFCEALENAGYWVGFYCNYDFYKNVVNGEDLAKRFSFWCATWGTDCPVESAQMWQFGGETNYLRSNQIAGMTVDQNYAFKDFPSLIKEKGLNGYTKSVETYRLHKVKKGENLWRIAFYYFGTGTRYKDIMTLNGLTEDVIYDGQILKIPNK